MTPPPQPEYIITETILNSIRTDVDNEWGKGVFDKYWGGNAIRSNPYTPQSDTPQSDVLQDLSNRLTAKTERCKQLEQEHQNFCFYIKKVSELEAELKTKTYNPQAERDKVLDVGEILESLCKTDLYWYNKGVTEGEDVSKCRGKDCNYCGRYNAESRTPAQEQP